MYFLQSVLCALHCAKTPEFESQQLSSIAVFRRVYVNRDENVQVARYVVVALLMCSSSHLRKSGFRPLLVHLQVFRYYVLEIIYFKSFHQRERCYRHDKILM